MPEQQTPITIHAVAEPSRKRRGEASEAAFLARATSMSFRICTPWGESERYDLVIDYGKGFDIPRRQRGKKDTPTRCRCKAIPLRCQVCPLLAKSK